MHKQPSCKQFAGNINIVTMLAFLGLKMLAIALSLKCACSSPMACKCILHKHINMCLRGKHNNTTMERVMSFEMNLELCGGMI